MNKANLALLISALLGCGSVALGAFGAHALEDLLAERGSAKTWDTAVHYLQWHTLGMLVLALGMQTKALPESAMRVVWIWLGGILFFSGSLFGLATGGPRWLGPVTPIGGILFMTGWLFLAGFALRKGRASS